MQTNASARRVPWELLLTTVFGAIGMFLLLIGTWASIAVVRLTTAWRPVIYRLEVSYLLLVTAGLLLCLSAHFARRRDWRATAIAATAGVAFCGMYFVIFPGPVPLK